MKNTAANWLPSESADVEPLPETKAALGYSKEEEKVESKEPLFGWEREGRNGVLGAGGGGGGGAKGRGGTLAQWWWGGDRGGQDRK